MPATGETSTTFVWRAVPERGIRDFFDAVMSHLAIRSLQDSAGHPG